tara:strand:+ start:541 stop:1839 length:1299 start_codon:yes stop_codon:yes gene_type:complete
MASTGKQMAAAIVKRNSNQGDKSSSIVRAPKAVIKSIPTQKLIPFTNLSKESSGDPSIDVQTNSIDKRLTAIITTVKQTIKVGKEDQKEENKQVVKKRRKKREKVLESASKFISGLASKVPAGMKKPFDAMKKFIGNIVVGSLILYILQQWDKIVESYKKVVKKIQEMWKALEPVISPIWDFLKWFTKFSVNWTARIMGIPDPEKNTIKENLDKIMDKISPLEKVFEGFKKVGEMLGISSPFKNDKENDDSLNGEEPVGGNRKVDNDIDRQVVEDFGGDKEKMIGSLKNQLENLSVMDNIKGVGSEIKKQIRRLEDPNYTPFVSGQSGDDTIKKSSTVSGQSGDDTIKKSPTYKIPFQPNADTYSGPLEMFEGLDFHTSYESRANSTIFMMSRNSPPPQGGGGSSTTVLPIALTDTSEETVSNLYQYALFKG